MQVGPRPLYQLIPHGAMPDPPPSAYWGQQFVAQAGKNWIDDHHCSSCHSTLASAMVNAGGWINSNDPHGRDWRFTRKWLNSRAEQGENGAPLYSFKQEESRDTEAILTALSLALDDAASGPHPVLRPLTRKALDRMWERHHVARDSSDPGWSWLNFSGFIPLETTGDGYMGAALAALATGTAPGGYARTPKAAEGIAGLRHYFAEHPTPNSHHGAILLWAAAHVPDLIAPSEKTRILAQLRTGQRGDGGWSLRELYGTGGGNGPAKSDGYATGLAVFALRESGVPKADPQIQKGLEFLKTHQSQGGAWFTPSLRADGKPSAYLTHLGTAFAVLALRSCGID